jgi:hypothetical protein
MKKFSKITGEKISDTPIVKEDPKKIEEANEMLAIRATIYRMVDTYLKVQLNGPLNWPGSITIEGKDGLTDALTNFVAGSRSKDQIKLLESLKGYSNDWEAIDRSIDDLKLKTNENLNQNLNKDKIKTLFKNYEADEETLYKMAEKQAERITNGESAFWRSIVAEQMIIDSNLPKNALKKVSQIFLIRSKQLGYKK